VPADVDEVLRRALARDPWDRHASLRELIEELACPPAADILFEPSPTQYVDAAEADSDPESVSVDSLIDVLSGVLTPESEHEEPARG
jgi:hypothetical protein